MSHQEKRDQKVVKGEITLYFIEIIILNPQANEHMLMLLSY